MLDLPRSVRLALWGSAALRGDVPADTAVRAVQRDDEPHTVSGDAAGTTLPELLTELAASGVPGLRAVLPVPGDPLGLAGPPAFTTLATEAGEAVVADGPGGPLGLVPDVTEFGSVLEPGAMVEWRVQAIATPPPPAEGLGDADRLLREALREATEALAGLDVSRWREDAAERIVAVRDGGLVSDALPPATDARLARVLASAARVRAIVELALEDDGASVTGWEATERSRALRQVDQVARRALVAAAGDHDAGRSSTQR
jgi:hypothetical protein